MNYAIFIVKLFLIEKLKTVKILMLLIVNYVSHPQSARL